MEAVVLDRSADTDSHFLIGDTDVEVLENDVAEKAGEIIGHIQGVIACTDSSLGVDSGIQKALALSFDLRNGAVLVENVSGVADEIVSALEGVLACVDSSLRVDKGFMGAVEIAKALKG